MTGNNALRDSQYSENALQVNMAKEKQQKKQCFSVTYLYLSIY